MKNLLIFLVLLITTGAQAQTPASVAKGRILTTDGLKIRFKNLSFDPDALRYQDINTAKALSIPADNVLSVEKQTGTEAGKWALILGASGLVGSLLGVWQAKLEAENSGLDTEDYNFTPLILGFTVGSALIGAAIGSGKKTYKKVYTNPKYEGTTMRPTLRIGFGYAPGQGAALGFQIGF